MQKPEIKKSLETRKINRWMEIEVKPVFIKGKGKREIIGYVEAGCLMVDVRRTDSKGKMAALASFTISEKELVLALGTIKGNPLK